MSALIALSTSSIYPETTSHGFEYASRLGFDAVEVMVGIDAASQDFAKVRSLRDYHDPGLRGARALSADYPTRLGDRPLGEVGDER